MRSFDEAKIAGVRFTVSTATIRSAIPQACAVATTFQIIRAFVARSGSLFIAASDTNRSLT